jgi:hypothetical protein
MTKNLMAAAPGPEQQLAEAKFKSHIAEYRERAAKHAAQVQREVSVPGSANLFVYRLSMLLSITSMREPGS